MRNLASQVKGRAKIVSRDGKYLDLRTEEINGGWRNLNNIPFGKHY